LSQQSGAIETLGEVGLGAASVRRGPVNGDPMPKQPQPACPCFSHWTLSASKLRLTEVEPGEVTNQVPLLLSLQLAPSTGVPLAARVSTETLCLVPLTMDAQPVAIVAALSRARE
jgi:hypothetical protein